MRSPPDTDGSAARLFVAAIAAFCAVSTASAQDAVSSGFVTPSISGYAAVTVASKYLYHGYVTDNHGPVVQPYAELFGEFYRGRDWLSSASVMTTLFSSFETRHDGSASTIGEPFRSWYEVEFEVGFEAIVAKQLTLSAVYRRFDSPNSAFGSSNGLAVAAQLDDRAWLGRLALYPHATWIAPFPANVDAEEGHYFQLGISPELIGSSEAPLGITVRLPINAGLGDSHYYLGQHFGYWSGGISARLPMSFLPSQLGSWELGASATYYYLGERVADVSHSGDRNVAVFAASVSTSF